MNNLLINLEARNTKLKGIIDSLKKEMKERSQRASEISFILVGIKGEIEANKQIIKKLKENK